jgi:hypothetical protein
MANYSLNKTAFKKEAYENTIDTSFAQIPPPLPPLEDTITVEEFFDLYESIFYDIPSTGANDSHEYLVKTSGEYINFEQNNEDVQALLDEITLLRQELLTANEQLLTLQTTIASGSSTI